jgi:predicted nucleic acid-binding protein
VILVDTAVWIDHLRDGQPELAELLEQGRVLAHPWVTGELSLGSLRSRDEILRLLDELPQAQVATHAELLAFIGDHELYGVGIGYVDAQLLAASMLTNAVLWTRDRRLRAPAVRLGVAHAPRSRK